jgi:hypothetical protein
MTRYLPILLLAGCAAVALDQPPPADWPKLVQIEHDVTHAELKRICGDAWGPILGGPLACTQFDFAKGECHKYFWTRNSFTLAQEDERCRGYDRYGETVVRDQWAAYKLHMRDAGLWADFNEMKKGRGW